jgi:hypothetical protein
MKRRLLFVGCLLLLVAACAVHPQRSGPLYYNGAYDHGRYRNDSYNSADGGRRQGRDGYDVRSGYTADSGWRL